jgi:hypothetical protein
MLGMKKQSIEEPEVIQKPSDEVLEKLVYEAYAEGLHLERAPNALGIGGRDGWCFTRLPVLCHEEIYNVRVSEYFPTRTAALQELPRLLELHRRHREVHRNGLGYYSFPSERDGQWRITFRSFERDLPAGGGPFATQEEALDRIDQLIEEDHEERKQEELQRQREAEERVAAAQIPKALQGHTFEGAAEVAKNYLHSKEPQTLIYAESDLKVGCAMIEALARDGYSTRYVATKAFPATRMLELTTPDLLLIHWEDSEAKDAEKVAADIVEVLQARTTHPTLVIGGASDKRLKKLIQDAWDDVPWQRFTGTDVDYRLAASHWCFRGYEYVRDQPGKWGPTLAQEQAAAILFNASQAATQDIGKAK